MHHQKGERESVTNSIKTWAQDLKNPNKFPSDAKNQIQFKINRTTTWKYLVVTKIDNFSNVFAFNAAFLFTFGFSFSADCCVVPFKFSGALTMSVSVFAKRSNTCCGCARNQTLNSALFCFRLFFGSICWWWKMWGKHQQQQIISPEGLGDKDIGKS